VGRHQAGGPCSEVSPSAILRPTLITNSDTTKFECNGLSQFSEDTGGASVPAGEFLAVGLTVKNSPAVIFVLLSI